MGANQFIPFTVSDRVTGRDIVIVKGPREVLVVSDATRDELFRAVHNLGAASCGPRETITGGGNADSFTFLTPERLRELLDVPAQPAPTARASFPVPPGVEIPEAAPTIARLFEIDDQERFRLFGRLNLLPPRERVAELRVAPDTEAMELARFAIAKAMESERLPVLADEINRVLEQRGR